MVTESRQTRIFFIMYSVLVLVVCGLMSQVQSSDAFWGWRHWTLITEKWVVANALGIFATSLAVYQVSRWKNERWNWALRSGLGVFVGGATWYLRLNDSWGDRTIFLEMLTHNQFFRMSQPLTTAVYAVIYQVTRIWNWPPRNAVALACSLSAGITILVLIAFLSEQA